MKPTNPLESSPNRNNEKGSTISGTDAYRRRWLPDDDRSGKERSSRNDYSRRDSYEQSRGQSRSQSPPRGREVPTSRYDSSNRRPDSLERSGDVKTDPGKRMLTCWFWATEGQNCVKTADECTFLHVWTDRIASRPIGWGQKGGISAMEPSSHSRDDYDPAVRRAVTATPSQSPRSLEESIASLLAQLGENMRATASIESKKAITKANRKEPMAKIEKAIYPSTKENTMLQDSESFRDQMRLQEDDIKNSNGLIAKKLASLIKSAGHWSDNVPEKIDVKPLMIEVKALQKSNVEKNQEIAELRDRIQSSADAISSAALRLGPSQKNLEERVEPLQTSNAQITKEMSDLKVQNIKLSWAVKDLVNIRPEINNELREIEGRAEESSAMCREILQEVKREIQELKSRSDGYSSQHEIQEVRAELQELRASLKGLSRQFESLRNTKSEIMRLEDTDLENSPYQRESLKELRNEVKEIKDRFDHSSHKQSKTILDIKQQSKALVQELTERLQELRRPEPSHEILFQIQGLKARYEELSLQYIPLKDMRVELQKLGEQFQTLSRRQSESSLASEISAQNINKTSAESFRHQSLSNEQARFHDFENKLKEASYQHSDSMQDFQLFTRELRDRLETTYREYEALRLEIQGDGNIGRKGLVDQVYDLQDGLLTYFHRLKANEKRFGSDLTSLHGKLEHVSSITSEISSRTFNTNDRVISTRPILDASNSLNEMPNQTFASTVAGVIKGNEILRSNSILQKLDDRCKALESSLTQYGSKFEAQISHLVSELSEMRNVFAKNEQITNDNFANLHDTIANGGRNQQQHDLAMHRDYVQASIEAVQQKLLEEVQAVHLGIRTLETCYQNLRTDQMAHHILSQLDVVYPRLRNFDSTIADLCNARQRHLHEQGILEQRLQAMERSVHNIQCTIAPATSPLAETINGRKRPYDTLIPSTGRENGIANNAEVSSVRYREDGDRMLPRSYEGSNIPRY